MHTGGDVGIALSLSDSGLEFLKVAGLPWLYDKISDITISDQEFKESILTVDISNINIHLPVPEGGLLNNWHTAMNSSNNAVSLNT